MKIFDPQQLQYYPKKSYADNLTTRRTQILQNLNISTQETQSPKNQFIPFVHERDHLGRLIKDVNNPPVLLRNDSFVSKISPYSPIPLPKTKSTSALPVIKSHHLQSLHKLVENSLCHTDYDSLTFASPTEMDHDRFSSNLFFIKTGDDKTLEVEHSATLPTKRRPLDGLISPKPFTNHRIESQGSVQTRENLPTHSRANFSEKLPPLDIDKVKGMGTNYQSGSVIIKSVDNLRPSADLNMDYPGLSPDTSTFANLTVWRYEADQISQNKEVQKMMKQAQAQKLGKPRNRVQKLTVPAKTQRVPPLGLYSPSLELIKARPKECLISPISITKQQIEKLRQDKQNELELQRMKAANMQKKEEEENEQRKDEQYYKNLFKDMFQEGNGKQKKNKKAALDQKVKQIKKLDYRILEDFETFPTDFESKVNNLRLKLRAFKEKLSSTKDGKSN